MVSMKVTYALKSGRKLEATICVDVYQAYDGSIICSSFDLIINRKEKNYNTAEKIYIYGKTPNDMFFFEKDEKVFVFEYDYIPIKEIISTCMDIDVDRLKASIIRDFKNLLIVINYEFVLISGKHLTMPIYFVPIDTETPMVSYRPIFFTPLNNGLKKLEIYSHFELASKLFWGNSPIPKGQIRLLSRETCKQEYPSLSGFVLKNISKITRL